MQNKQQYTPVRFSHLTSYAGIGAIVRDSNDILMTITDIRYWTDRNGICTAEPIPYVTRITSALGIGKELRVPPQAQEQEDGPLKGHYLPAVLFPTYAACKKCGILHGNPWKEVNSHLKENLRCKDKKCNGQLEQVTGCAISKQGYLDDVPWHYICHFDDEHTCTRNNPGDCKVDFQGTYLRLNVNRDGRKIVQCTRCGSGSQFTGKKIGVINKQQPWINGKPQPVEEQDVEIVEVNSSGVYFPERINALVIPPESRMNKGTVVDQLYNNSQLCRDLEAIRSPLRKKGKIRKLATQYRCKVEEIHDALQQIKDGYPELDIITSGDMLEDEYQAFLTPLENQLEDEDFVTDHKTDPWQDLSPLISGELLSINKFINNLVVAKRLREIQIFKGFRRQDPGAENLVPPDLEGDADWLPAIELFGEGVFFTLDEDLLAGWEKIQGVRIRADEIGRRYENSGLTLFEEPLIIPRFLLLHTLSHLLIRELETTAGYPAASLKERVYCSVARKMSGILIYTAVSDIAGSLGGIIESTKPKQFLSLLNNVFKHASWCSLDPVCSEHEGQGPGWLNRAACHACALIPEPSCAYSNVFLDRVFIKGNKELGIPNLLEYVGEQTNG